MMINPQLIANAASNLVKNELKLDTKTPKNDFNVKESALTGSLKKNLGLTTATQAKLVSIGDEDLNLKLKNLVNKVLDQLFAKSTPNEKLATQSERLNFAPNFSNEIKFLVSEMKKSDIFSELLGKLEQILKPASEVKADNFAPLFKNSGVFFEAKLKDALNTQTLPKSFHSLLSAIKSLNSPKISNEIITLATKDLDPKSSLNELKNILNSQKNENAQVLQKTNFKTLLALNTKVENFKNYISKNPNFAQSHIKELAANILKQLNKIEANFKAELARPENLALKDTKFLSNLSQSFASLKNTLKAFSKGDFSALKQPTNAINPTPNTPAQKVNFVESQKAEFVSVSKGKNADESTISNAKESVKADDTSVLNGKGNSNTNEPKQENKSVNANLQEGKASVANESAKSITPNSALNSTPQSPANESNISSKITTPQENIEQENATQKPNSAPANLAENEILDETTAKNSPNLDKNTPNSAKNESAKPNPQTQSSLANNTDKANLASKNDTNAPNKASNEKPNTPNPTQANVSEVKTSQDKAISLNESLKFTQNENPQVKNLIFTNEKTQMPELEHLNKELNTLLRRTNEGLKQLDNVAQEAKINLTDIKNLERKIERASRDLAQIAPKDGTQISNELKNDIKSTLLQVANVAKNEGNEAMLNQTNRLLAQIEFNQLMSLANDSINTYLPLFWEDLNESKVIFKRGKKDKYFAQIKLNFAKLGELDILIALKQDKYLDINIMAEHKAFRKTIYEHSHELRRALGKAGLLSSNFFVGDIIRSKLAPQITHRDYDFQMGVDKRA